MNHHKWVMNILGVSVELKRLPLIMSPASIPDCGLCGEEIRRNILWPNGGEQGGERISPRAFDNVFLMGFRGIMFETIKKHPEGQTQCKQRNQWELIRGQEMRIFRRVCPNLCNLSSFILIYVALKIGN